MREWGRIGAALSISHDLSFESRDERAEILWILSISEKTEESTGCW